MLYIHNGQQSTLKSSTETAPRTKFFSHLTKIKIKTVIGRIYSEAPVI